MASEMYVDTIAASDGTSPATLTKQSAAKAWNRISISGGTPSSDDSLNSSSVTDNAVGNYQTNLTSNMSNTNYLAPNFSSYQDTTQDLDRYGAGDYTGGGNDSRATTGAQVCGYWNGSYVDTVTAGTMAFGDLA